MDTVSEFVSERIERAVKNCSGLKRIVIEFTGVFAILFIIESDVPSRGATMEIVMSG